MSTLGIAPRLERGSHAVRTRLARPRWAVVELHVATPISPSGGDPPDLVDHFRHTASLAGKRAAAIVALTEAGWVMDRPTVRLDEPERLGAELLRAAQQEESRHVASRLCCDGFLDFDIRFRKRFRTSHDAERAVLALALDDGTDNWDLGWDERPDGDVAWWCALHDLDDRDR